MTSPGHPITGGIVSSVLILATVVVTLPHSSVAVKVTVVKSPHTSSFTVVKSLVQVIPEHASDALAPPLVANQASISAELSSSH